MDPQPSPPPEQQQPEQRPKPQPVQQTAEPETEGFREPGKIKRYIQECLRVLKVTKKPTLPEFKTIVKVSGLGMLIIGLIGFIINIVREIVLK